MEDEEAGIMREEIRPQKLKPRLVISCKKIPYSQATASMVLKPPLPFNEVNVNMKRKRIMLMEVVYRSDLNADKL